MDYVSFNVVALLFVVVGSTGYFPDRSVCLSAAIYPFLSFFFSPSFFFAIYIFIYLRIGWCAGFANVLPPFSLGLQLHGRITLLYFLCVALSRSFVTNIIARLSRRHRRGH